ncbi:MAG: MJ1477/TM1410 family putative glycoside hydrolase [Candidatus Njordarchaeota archaeon]
MCKKIIVLFLFIVIIFVTFYVVLFRQQKVISSWAYQLQNADPVEISKSKFDLVVIDYSRDGTDEMRYTSEEIDMIKKAGIIPLAYISIGEAEDWRFYWNDSWHNDPPKWLGNENSEWPGCYAVEYWYYEWHTIIFRYVDKILEAGFVGLYLDKVDEFEYWSDPDNGENFTMLEEESAELMIDFIIEISEYARSKVGENFIIVPQNGERLLEYDNGSLLEMVSGWAVEDLFYNGLEKLSFDITNERTKYIDRVRSSGKFVLVVDYVDDGSGYSGENKNRIDDFIQLSRSRGYVPYVAKVDRELDELNIIPSVQPHG